MPIFRARCRDHCEHTVTADRVIADSHLTVFERLRDHGWDVVLELPTDNVQAVHRRITEMDGRWRWCTERPTPSVGLRFRPATPSV